LETVLSISNLSKHFGRIKAVNNLNLEIKQGQVFGMLGPNGSGKTTTLGMLMGVVNPTAGLIPPLDNSAGLVKRQQMR
jgi:ABC-type multidrug transport system ATPase subunit